MEEIYDAKEQKELSAKENDILEELEDYILKVKEVFDRKSPEELEETLKNEANARIIEEYHMSIFKAIKAKLHTNPIVRDEIKKVIYEWRRSREAAGEKELLRKPRLGLEKGIKRPLKKDEVIILNELWDLLKKGESFSEAHRTLTNNSVIPEMTRQAFIKWVKVRDPFFEGYFALKKSSKTASKKRLKNS